MILFAEFDAFVPVAVEASLARLAVSLATATWLTASDQPQGL